MFKTSDKPESAYAPVVVKGKKVGHVHWLQPGVSGLWAAEPGEFPDRAPANVTESFYVLEGAVTVEFEDGRSVSLKPGDMLTIEKSEKTFWTFDRSSRFRKFYVAQ